MCGEYTDYTRSYHHPGAQFWVGSSRNWPVFLERPNTGRHEKAPVRGGGVVVSTPSRA